MRTRYAMPVTTSQQATTQARTAAPVPRPPTRVVSFA